MSKLMLVATMLALHMTGANAASPSIGEHLSAHGTRFVLVSVAEADELVIQVAWPTDWAVNRDTNHVAPILATRSQFLGGAESSEPGALNVHLNDAGAEAHLTLDSQFVYCSIVLPDNGAEGVLAAINANLRSPRFDEQWFRRIRDAYLDHLGKLQRDPSSFALDTLRWSAFGDHPLRRSKAFGELDAVRNVKRSDLVAWADATYTSVPHALIVAGDIDAGTASRLVDLLLQGLPGNSRPPATPPVGAYNAGKVLIHVPHAKDSYIAIAGAVEVSAEWPKYHDGFIVRTLSRSGGGILNDAVRGLLRAAYFIKAEFGESHYDSHFLLIHGSVESAMVDSSVEELLRSYSKYVESPSVEGLDRFRSRTLETLKRTRNDVIDLSLATLRAVLRGHDVSAVLERVARAERLSPDMIRERVRDGYPKARDLLVVVASPDADALSGACVIEAPKEVLECDLN